ncbi:MAG: hypothetical protein EBZ77_09710, partial [Chitinophagia bacterium]|nr:hypothetical protein [Chitinophagia bacterium]
MRFFAVLLFFLALPLWGESAPKKRYHGLARTEAELMNNVLSCLRTKDTVGYYNLFPPFDTLWAMVIDNPANSPEAVQQLNNLKAHPTILIDFDPFYNKEIMGRFARVLRKGEDSGLQWGGIVMQRYELQKQGVAPGMEGISLIAPERFKGFMFVRDLMSSTTFCITIKEIQKINDFFCGGQVLNVMEANSIDEYLAKEEAERRWLARLQRMAAAAAADSARKDSAKSDTLLGSQPVPIDSFAKDTGVASDSTHRNKSALYAIPPAEDEGVKTKREVVDRKLYKGKFDEEIPVELYVRYMRDANGKVTNWDGLYKFGDMQEFVKLDVTKKDGIWTMEEPVATMELELNEKVYTGSWTNGSTQTGYDAELKQVELPQQKAMDLDYILENGIWGKTGDQKIDEPDDDGGK